MEKPSGYGPDIAGSNPAGSTRYVNKFILKFMGVTMVIDAIIWVGFTAVLIAKWHYFSKHR